MMEMKRCPYCSEEVKKDATKCRYCGERLSSDKLQRSDQRQNREYASPRQRVEQTHTTNYYLMNLSEYLPSSDTVTAEEEISRLKKQNLKGAQILQIFLLIFSVLAGVTVFCTQETNLLTMSVDRIMGLVVFVYIFAVPIVVKKYLLNFEYNRVTRTLISLFTGGIILLFTIYFVNNLLLDWTISLDELRKRDLIYISIRTVLYISLIITSISIGGSLIFRIKDYVGGLKQLGYVVCAFSLCILTIYFMSLFHIQWLFSFSKIAIFAGVILSTLALLNIFTKAIQYTKKHKYDTSNVLPTHKEPEINLVKLFIAIVFIFILTIGYIKEYENKNYTSNKDWQEWVNAEAKQDSEEAS